MRNSFMRHKKTEAREQQIRKPTHEQIEAMNTRVLQGHDRMGEAGGSVDNIHMAQHMVTHGICLDESFGLVFFCGVG